MTNIPYEGGNEDTMGCLHVSNGKPKGPKVAGSEEEFRNDRIPHTFKAIRAKLKPKVARRLGDFRGSESGPQDSFKVVGNPVIRKPAKVDHLTLGGVELKPHRPIGSAKEAKNFGVGEENIVGANRCVVSEACETKGVGSEK